MRNKKGQALVEFILILPVFLLLIIGTIDIGNIIYQKYKLEDQLDSVVERYRKENTIEKAIEDTNIQIDISTSSNYTTIKLSKKIKIQTPILNNIIGKNITIETKRTIYETSDE
jgi:Flp pilus assembly protein TadG